uniref:Uncharacterized protein n=1 Tax=Anguilla anguilla TaxID=7936 RepID=A0A0E9T964_ANGAN
MKFYTRPNMTLNPMSHQLEYNYLFSVLKEENKMSGHTVLKGCVLSTPPHPILNTEACVEFQFETSL